MRDELRSDGAGLRDLFDLGELERRLERGPRTANEAFQLWVIFNLQQWRHAQQANRRAA